MIEYGDATTHAKYRAQIDFWGKVYLVVTIMVNNYLWFKFFCYLGDYLWLWCLAYMLTGAWIIEWTWYNTTRLHNVDDVRDSCFPAFRRLDAKHWKKWRHYPLAVTLLPLKIWSLFIIAPGTAAVSRIITLGNTKRPYTGWRKWLLDVHFKGMNIFILLVQQMFIKFEELDDIDYSEWLGPGYKEKQVLPQKIATHIGAPHSVWLDTTVTLAFENHSFCTKKEAENVPVFSGILHGN